MENGGNDKYWRGQTSNHNNNNNNNNVWWDLAHLGLGEEEEEMAGASRPYDYWTGNVVLMNSHDHHHHHHHQEVVVVEEEEEEEEVVMLNPPPPSISNGGGGVAKAKQQQQYISSSSLYSSGSSHVYPDPHLTCLKLGHSNNNNNKRRQYYFEDGISSTTTTALWKKGKCYSGGGGGLFGGSSSSSSTTVVNPPPKCQVDGCHVELLCAKEYHRRHKVCEVHSKATKVEVLGIEQRFCQQCSRFHVMTEFDDSKRSCRRRLAGHNERRRKISSSSSSSNDSITSTTRKCFDKAGAGGLPHTKTPSLPRVSNALSRSSVNSLAWVHRRPTSSVVNIVLMLHLKICLLRTVQTSYVASQLILNQPIIKNIKPKMLTSCNKKEKG